MKIKRFDLLKEVFDEKVTSILRIFLENPTKDLTLTDISEESGISISTAHRKLNKLISGNIVNANRKENAKKIHSYRLGRSEKVSTLSRIFDSELNYGNLN